MFATSMKRSILFCLLLLGAWTAAAGTYRAEQIPDVQRADRRRYVSNPDGILSPRAVARIDSLCGALRERDLAQVAVVAVDDIAADDVFSFAIELFRSWGVGRADVDNGLGILLVKDRREIRFVTGGGLEGVLPDAICKRIQLEYMLPRFREGDYDGGMVAGVAAAAVRIEGGELDFAPEAENDLPLWGVLAITALLAALVLAVLVWVGSVRKRCPNCHKRTLTPVSQQVVKRTRNYTEVEHTYVCSNCGEKVRRRVRNMRDDGFGGGMGGGMIIGGGLGGVGGGSSGGFGGGFGGGSFGGGGAGSRW